MLFYFHPGDLPFWLFFIWVVVIPAALIALGVWALSQLGVGETPKSHDEKVSPLRFSLRETDDEENK
jgi:hypothetical protein